MYLLTFKKCDYFYRLCFGIIIIMDCRLRCCFNAMYLSLLLINCTWRHNHCAMKCGKTQLLFRNCLAPCTGKGSYEQLFPRGGASAPGQAQKAEKCPGRIMLGSLPPQDRRNRFSSCDTRLHCVLK